MTAERTAQALAALKALPTNEALTVIEQYADAELTECYASDHLYNGLAGIREELLEEARQEYEHGIYPKRIVE